MLYRSRTHHQSLQPITCDNYELPFFECPQWGRDHKLPRLPFFFQITKSSKQKNHKTQMPQEEALRVDIEWEYVHKLLEPPYSVLSEGPWRGPLKINCLDQDSGHLRFSVSLQASFPLSTQVWTSISVSASNFLNRCHLDSKTLEKWLHSRFTCLPSLNFATLLPQPCRRRSVLQKCWFRFHHWLLIPVSYSPKFCCRSMFGNPPQLPISTLLK